MQKETGYSYVTNLIQRGYIKESLYGTEKNKVLKTYWLSGKEPDYDFSGRIATKRRKLMNIKEIEPVETKPKQVEISINNRTPIEIITPKVTVKISDTNENIIKLVKEVLLQNV